MKLKAGSLRGTKIGKPLSIFIYKKRAQIKTEMKNEKL